MTLVGARDGQEADYLDVAEALADHGSSVTADLQQLWRRVAFSIAIHNTDDHLRNHGLLHHRGGWTLSPLFDVNPNPNAAALRATSINFRHHTDPTIERANLLEVAPHFGWSGTDAEATFDEITDVVRTRWRDTARSNGVAEAELRHFAEVLDR